jgi:hypothetical protein
VTHIVDAANPLSNTAAIKITGILSIPARKYNIPVITYIPLLKNNTDLRSA